MLSSDFFPTPLVIEAGRESQDAVAKYEGGTSLLSSAFVILRFCGLLVTLHFSRLDRRAKARRIRIFIESRGGIWFKIAQIFGVRRDILPAEYCDELDKLQDRASVFSPDESRRIIEEDLHQPLTKLFSKFSAEPVAAASIGQVHQAVLRSTGVRVAVKVQRPGIVAIFHRDLAFVALIAHFLDKVTLTRRMRWSEMFAELERMTNEELDYRIEAGSMIRMRKSLKPHRVYVPKVFLPYCAGRVLVAEWINGVSMADYLRAQHNDPSRLQAWLRANDIEPAKVGRRLFDTMQRQIFEDNQFHADLHPGNIILLRKSRLALIDFGAIGSLDNSVRNRLLLYNQFMTRGDYARAMIVLLRLSAPLPPIDFYGVIKDFVRCQQHVHMVTTSKAFSHGEKMLHPAIREQTQIMARHHIPVSWDFLRLHRSQLSLDVSVRYLDPSFEYEKLMNRYFRSARRREREGADAALVDNIHQLLTNIRERTAEAKEVSTLLDGGMDALTSSWMRSASALEHTMYVLQNALGWILVLIGLLSINQHLPSLLPAFLRAWIAHFLGSLPRLSLISWAALLLLAFFMRRIARRLSAVNFRR